MVSRLPLQLLVWVFENLVLWVVCVSLVFVWFVAVVARAIGLGFHLHSGVL